MSPSFVFQGLKKQSSLPPGCSASMWEGCLLVPSPAQFLRWLRRGLKRTTVGCIQVRRNIWGKIRNISGPYVCVCVCVCVCFLQCIHQKLYFHIIAISHYAHTKMCTPSLPASETAIPSAKHHSSWMTVSRYLQTFLEPIHSILAFCAHSASSTFIFQ